MGMHSHTLSSHTQCTHLSMLEAGGSDLSEGFLLWPVCQTVWRAVEGLASPRLACRMKKPVTCAFCGPATSLSSPPLLPPSLTHPPPHSPPFSSRSGLPAETGRLILPCSPPLLYPSDKALCISFSTRLPLCFSLYCL